MPSRLYINEDNVLEWRNARFYIGGGYVNTGTCTWALKQDAEPESDIAVGALAYVGGTNGLWRGIVESAVTGLLIVNSRYYFEILLVSGDAQGFRREDVVAEYHGQDTGAFSFFS